MNQTAPAASAGSDARVPLGSAAAGRMRGATLGSGLTLVPSVNASWRDKSEVGTSNVTFYDDPVTSSAGTVYANNLLGNGPRIAGSLSKARWIANATLTLRSEAGWSIAAECRNCFDTEAVESTLANLEYINPPRAWLIKGRYSF